MKTLLTLSLIMTSTLFATSMPLHVELDIYSNKAFLKKTYAVAQKGEITTKIPQYLSLEQIRYTLDKGCSVDNSRIEKLNTKELVKNKNEIAYKITALNAKSELLKTLSLKNTSENTKIQSITALLVESLTNNMIEIESLNREIKEINKKIKESTKELKINFTCKENDKNIKITYPKNSIRYTPFYDISANIHNKSVTIEKKATLIYQGVEDYKNIDLNIYSYRYNQNVAPQHFYPRYLGQKRAILYAKKSMAMDRMQVSADENIKAQYKELATKSLYKIQGAKLKKDEKNLLHVDKEIVNTDFKTIIDAYGSGKAYLEATIKTKKDYSGANSNFFLNQNSISARYINKIQKGKKTKLYFGEDEHIQIQKELIKTLDEKTFFGDKKISTQNWKYTITNKKPYSTNIEFITRVPVSKDGDIVVKTLAQPKFDSQSAKGKTIWNFKLIKNGKKEIIFGYEISNSK